MSSVKNVIFRASMLSMTAATVLLNLRVSRKFNCEDIVADFNLKSPYETRRLDVYENIVDRTKNNFVGIQCKKDNTIVYHNLDDLIVVSKDIYFSSDEDSSDFVYLVDKNEGYSFEELLSNGADLNYVKFSDYLKYTDMESDDTKFLFDGSYSTVPIYSLRRLKGLGIGNVLHGIPFVDAEGGLVNVPHSELQTFGKVKSKKSVLFSNQRLS